MDVVRRELNDRSSFGSRAEFPFSGGIVFDINVATHGMNAYEKKSFIENGLECDAVS